MNNRARIIVLVLLLAASASPSNYLDPLWLFTDTSDNPYYQILNIYDTSQSQQIRYPLIDSGLSGQDGSPYIKFDYQFSSDSVFWKDPYDANLIIKRDLRPGYAGFNVWWDEGITPFPLARYKYLIFAHKGPPPAQKVTMRWWYRSWNEPCDGVTGASILRSKIIGSFSSSGTWKVDTIVIPDSIQNLPDCSRNFREYYVMEIDIHNLDPKDTTSGLPGCLEMDNIMLVGRNPIDSSPQPAMVMEGETATLRVVARVYDTIDILTYQWNKNGVAMPGKNSSVLTLRPVKTSDAGVYTVTVANSSTNISFTSREARLIVRDSSKCGCGSGTGLALLPPLFFKLVSCRKRKKNSSRSRSIPPF